MSSRGTTKSIIMSWTASVTCDLIKSISDALGPITDKVGNEVVAQAAITSSKVSSFQSLYCLLGDGNKLRMEGVKGTALICLGFFFCFYGKKIFRPSIGLMGFFAFGLLGLLAGSWYSFHYEFTDEPFWVMVFSLLLGSLGAMLCIKIWKLAIASVSMAAGYIGTQYLLTMSQPFLNVPIQLENFFLFLNTNNVFNAITPYTNYICAFGVLMSYILSRYFEDSIVLFGTSIIGAISMIYGVDFFTNYGFKMVLMRCIQCVSLTKIDHNAVKELKEFNSLPNLMFMNFACLALIVLGVAVQYITASPKKKNDVSSA